MDNFFSRSQLLKELINTMFTVVEYPGLLLHFLPEGHLQVWGKDPKTPINITYSLIHNGDNWILATAPHLLQKPSNMKLLIMKNHITLVSLANEEEVLHLNRLKIKSY